MAAIRPRWEWRAFGPAFASAEEALANVPTTDVVESDELYLVAPGEGDVAKVRAGLMDVKHLREVAPQNPADPFHAWSRLITAQGDFPTAVREVAADLRAQTAACAAPNGQKVFEDFSYVHRLEDPEVVLGLVVALG